MNRTEAARRTDTSIIEPGLTEGEVVNFFHRARKYPFAAIGVDLCYVPLAHRLLKDTETAVVAVVSYPLGACSEEVSVACAEWAVARGAGELDVGMNLGWLRSGQYRAIERFYRRIVDRCPGCIVKAVITSSIMTEEEIISACEAAQQGGVHFIKTNPGFGYVTAVDCVKLIKSRFGDSLKVMAAAGIRTADQARAMFAAGADRVATSTPFRVLAGFPE